MLSKMLLPIIADVESVFEVDKFYVLACIDLLFEPLLASIHQLQYIYIYMYIYIYIVFIQPILFSWVVATKSV